MADKKLLEEATIRRFMQLANITPSEKGVLKESSEVAGGRSANPTRGNSGEVQSNGQSGPIREKKKAYNEELDEADDLEDTDSEMDMGDMDLDSEPEMDDAGGDDAGMEGGELESAVEEVVAGLNKLFAATGLNKEVEIDSDSEGSDEPPADDMDMDAEGGAPMMEKKARGEDKDEKSENMEEDLEESIELVDDSLVEKLLQRVSARLVAEARKVREGKLAEAKGGSGRGWLIKKPHSKSKSGHGPGKGKKSTPFSKPVSGVKGTAGRGR